MSTKLPPTNPTRLPREIAPGIHWLGACSQVEYEGHVLHGSASIFLILGADQVLLLDTGRPGDWVVIEKALDLTLQGRQINWIVPTHPELPHCGNLGRLLDKYPAARAIGDMRDYHVYFPNHASRLETWPKDKPVQLGGGYRFNLLEAPIKDLTSTQWGYESHEQVMFVSDAFQFLHHGSSSQDVDEPLHEPGECGLLSTELSQLPQTYQATLITRGAFSWTRYMDASEFFDQLTDLLERFPARLIAPTHGYVIMDLASIWPITREAYRPD